MNVFVFIFIFYFTCSKCLYKWFIDTDGGFIIHFLFVWLFLFQCNAHNHLEYFLKEFHSITSYIIRMIDGIALPQIIFKLFQFRRFHSNHQSQKPSACAWNLSHMMWNPVEICLTDFALSNSSTLFLKARMMTRLKGVQVPNTSLACNL